MQARACMHVYVYWHAAHVSTVVIRASVHVCVCVHVRVLSLARRRRRTGRGDRVLLTSAVFGASACWSSGRPPPSPRRTPV